MEYHIIKLGSQLEYLLRGRNDGRHDNARPVMSTVNGILFGIIVTHVEWLLHFVALTHIMQIEIASWNMWKILISLATLDQKLLFDCHFATGFFAGCQLL